MANVIQQQLQTLWGRVQSGPVGAFFQWWITELRLAMPQAWQDKLEHALRRVVLVLEDDQVRIGVDESRAVETLESYPLSQEASIQHEQISDLLTENDLVEAPRFLLLRATSVLRKTVRLPQAAEANLVQVLSFEMDRQTPFRAADVYFDHRIVSRLPETSQIEIEIFVVPKQEIDGRLKALSERGISLSGVDLVEHGGTFGLNLLPAAQRSRTANPRARLNLVLGVALALLLAVVMAESLALRQHQVEELEEAIADVQGEARAVMRIRDQIDDAREAAGFLATRRSAQPPAISVLAEVTRILPDDTFLDRLVIGSESVQMQGKSQDAQKLIELVNESDLLSEASFRGSTRLDARTGLEIFEVNAQVGAAGDD